MQQSEPTPLPNRIYPRKSSNKVAESAKLLDILKAAEPFTKLDAIKDVEPEAKQITIKAKGRPAIKKKPGPQYKNKPLDIWDEKEKETFSLS